MHSIFSFEYFRIFWCGWKDFSSWKPALTVLHRHCWCPFSPCSVFPRKGTYWESNVRAGRIVVTTLCISNLSSSSYQHCSAPRFRDLQANARWDRNNWCCIFWQLPTLPNTFHLQWSCLTWILLNTVIWSFWIVLNSWGQHYILVDSQQCRTRQFFEGLTTNCTVYSQQEPVKACSSHFHTNLKFWAGNCHV